MSDNGWNASAAAWVAWVGDEGDWARRHLLDPVALGRLDDRRFRRALDVGCGEGRFCRLLRDRGIPVTGLEPSDALIAAARERDPSGDYRQGWAERLEFEDASFDLVVSYLTLIDIDDMPAAVSEMARVLRPGGTLLIVNLASILTAMVDQTWIRRPDGTLAPHPVDHYLQERSMVTDWAGIRVRNWHRPLGTYMQALIGAGLHLAFFVEPDSVSPAAAAADPERVEKNRRVPWFVVMEWLKPPA